MALQVKGLILDRLSLSPLLGPGAIRLGGKLEGKAELAAEKLSNPAGWKGELEFRLGSGKIYPFQAQGIQVEEINYTRGDLKVKIQEGAATLENLKLEGPDLPLEAKGNISLRQPLSASVMDIAGTVEASPNYKQKMPMLNGLLPPEKKFTYQGTIGNLAALLK